MTFHTLLSGAAFAALALVAAPAAAATCENLAGVKLPDGVVESATPTAASDSIALGGSMPGLPAPAAFCRVKVRLKPTASSDIGVEVWLPEKAAWNGKFLGAGNGGYGGGFMGPFLMMRGGVAKGFAAAGTDMGHTGKSDTDASWALGQPEKIKDFGYRANHLTARAAKTLITAYYGGAPKLSYFHGCSDGGREALMEASRFPDDYDAIIAGAPAAPWTRLMTAFAWNAQTVAATPIPAAKLAVVQNAVMAQCDKQDGVADGVLENPAACHFDPKTVQCKTGDAADCLTPAQITALRRIYSGPTTRGGRSLYPGFPVGGEAVPGAWDSWIVKPDGQHAKFSTEFFRNMVFDDVSWNPATFDAERDLKSARARQGGTLDSDNADLSAFKARGGKLILYHGWADAAIPAGSTIEYYKALEARTGGDFVRMFLMPGMSHCLGGPGPNVFDALGTLDAWRGGGPAPEQMIATKFDNDLFGFLGFPAKPVRTRPICVWPKTARWDGKGSTDEAASFACVTENSVSRRP